MQVKSKAVYNQGIAAKEEKVLEKMLNANFQAQDQEPICLTLSYEDPPISAYDSKVATARADLNKFLSRLYHSDKNVRFSSGVQIKVLPGKARRKSCCRELLRDIAERNELREQTIDDFKIRMSSLV